MDEAHQAVSALSRCSVHVVAGCVTANDGMALAQPSCRCYRPGAMLRVLREEASEAGRGGAGGSSPGCPWLQALCLYSVWDRSSVACPQALGALPQVSKADRPINLLSVFWGLHQDKPRKHPSSLGPQLLFFSLRRGSLRAQGPFPETETETQQMCCPI